VPAGPQPEFGLYLTGRRPDDPDWPARWVRWPDFRLPSDRVDAAAALAEAYQRSAGQRVEVACGGGIGRTGTALACLAILDGVEPGRAVAFVRENYHRRAVETPWQRRYVAAFRR
jgi:protein-tyrosine phosphatase